MKRKAFPFLQVLLGCLLFLLANLPKKGVDELRSFAVASLVPVWSLSDGLSHYLRDRPIGTKRESDRSLERERLELENRQLRAEIEPLLQWAASAKEQESLWKAEQRYRPLPARILYRDPSSWSSTLWVYVGEEDNQRRGYRAVGKNSPVLFGGSLVGVVDFVGKRQSRVRLLTDSAVSPAVRVLRGKSESERLGRELSALQEELAHRGDLFSSAEEQRGLLTLFALLRSRLGQEAEDLFLAKGELQGSGASLWRARALVLRGVGFNLDYADAQGPARELRSGRLLKAMTKESEKPLPLIREGDLLVTSGLDGIFPSGLFVATVTYVAPLQEGNYAYEIEARPTAKELNHLEMVFILPPLSGEECSEKVSP